MLRWSGSVRDDFIAVIPILITPGGDLKSVYTLGNSNTIPVSEKLGEGKAFYISSLAL